MHTFRAYVFYITIFKVQPGATCEIFSQYVNDRIIYIAMVHTEPPVGKANAKWISCLRKLMDLRI